MQAKGTFKVDLQPTATEVAFTAPTQFGAMSINKEFSGDLVASSVGQMMSVRVADTSSAGYVALEQVTGSLLNKEGSFVLQHYGIMSAQSQNLTLEVVPDSGTNELLGINGSLSIEIKEGQHYYVFDFNLP